MRPWLKFCWQGFRFCGACLASFCLWTLWLALAVLLVFQLYIANSRELALPEFLLRSLEQRLAESGVRAEFGRASFDPAGHVLIEQAQLYLPAFPEPILTARSVYVTLDLWSLSLGRFEARELQVTGASLYVTAMLSGTGRSEPLVHDLDFTFVPEAGGFALPQLAGRLADLNVTARGAWQSTDARRNRAAREPLPELLARSYPAICRQLTVAAGWLAPLESPSVNLVLTPEPTRGAVLELELLAAGLKLTAPRAAEATGLRAVTRMALPDGAPVAALVNLTADAVKLPGLGEARGVQAAVHGRLPADLRRFDFQRLELSARAVTTQGLATGPVALGLTGPLPDLRGTLALHLLGEPLAVEGTVRTGDRSARLHAAGRFAPGLMAHIGRRVGRDLRPFIDFRTAPAFDLAVRLDPGLKFAGVEGRVAGGGVDAYHVSLDAFSGHVAFDGRRFIATDAYARIGSNFARGSYEHDFASREFRFLLNGRLDPPAINGWFREWWPHFWSEFDFANGAPDADVDVRGRWGHGVETTVFVFADCTSPIVRGVKLDHAIARLFIRPGHVDALEVFATRGGGAARGNFVRHAAYPDNELDQFTFDFDSTLELPDAAALGGPELRATLQPFVFAEAPAVRARGTLTGAGSPHGVHRQIHLTGRGTGAFSLYGFPLHNLDFGAEMKDDALVISPIEAGFAGGTVTGSVKLTGPADKRRLGFTLSLRDGSLRDAATILETYSANRKGAAPAANSEYIERSAQVRMALDLIAEGDAADPYSFTGTGHADLNGQGLGRIRLLGLLSELLNFTALRFDTLKTDFTVERNALVFPHVNLTGPDAAVTARGRYLLDRKELDFYARVFPFQESTFILKSVVGLVLTPLSGVLEVKLSGRLDKPAWAFVIGPTNFLRSIFTTPAKSQAPTTNPAPATPPPKPKSP